MSEKKKVGTVKYSTEHQAVIDLVAHKHWVAVYEDKRGAQNIRLVSSKDAWDFDVQIGLKVFVVARPHNKCKLIKIIERPL